MRRELKGWLADILIGWALHLDPERFVAPVELLEPISRRRPPMMQVPTT
jgi:hypothetical protein